MATNINPLKIMRLKKVRQPKVFSNVIIEKTSPFKVYEKPLDTDITVSREITSVRSVSQEHFSTSNMKDFSTSHYDKMKMIHRIECEPFGFVQI
jgi:hypothetical protein